MFHVEHMGPKKQALQHVPRETQGASKKKEQISMFHVEHCLKNPKERVDQTHSAAKQHIPTTPAALTTGCIKRVAQLLAEQALMRLLSCMLKAIARTEFLGPWRKHQALPLVCFSIGLSSLAAFVPNRLSNSVGLWSESLLATQLLACLLFVLVVSVFGMSPTRFLWSASKIGPVAARNEWVLLAQNFGQILALLTIWLPVFLFQVIGLPMFMDIDMGEGFIPRSIAVFLGGVGLMAWGRLFAVIMPTSAAMLATVGLVVLGQFLLLSHGDAGFGFATTISPGLEFVFRTSGAKASGISWLAIISLVVSLVGISNLLSAWILETWHGVLCSLDHGDTRS
ncbi:MAG: hypothetical protein ACI97A_000011 [Planctomycetota bacterium]|jgi:hypothetical protein